VKNQRNERVNAQFKEEIADLLRKVKDPRVGFVSVTEVDVTPDLKQARIYVSVLGDEATKRSTLEGLKSASGFVKSELAKRVRLRLMPEFEWRYDTSLAHGARINELLHQVGLGGQPATSEPAATDPDDDTDDDTEEEPEA
jgi:ribosome-binding factor A